MSVQRTYRIICDGCGCDWGQSGHETIRQARAHVKREYGWGRIRLPEWDVLHTDRNHHTDLCPDCLRRRGFA